MDRDRVIDYLACLTDAEFAALAAARTSKREEVSPGTGGRRWEHVGAASPPRRRVIDPDTTEPTPA
jgi:hypothetical protein